VQGKEMTSQSDIAELRTRAWPSSLWNRHTWESGGQEGEVAAQPQPDVVSLHS
jgi:hypothetical protein